MGPSGARLVAVAQGDANGGVDVWRRLTPSTWGHEAITASPAFQPTLAWATGTDAYLAWANETGGCPATGNLYVASSTDGGHHWAEPASGVYGPVPFARSWPRMGSSTTGVPMLVSQQTDCVTGVSKVAVAWKAAHFADWAKTIEFSGSYPALANLGTVGDRTTFALAWYDASSSIVRFKTCYIDHGPFDGFNDWSCGAVVTLGNAAAAGPITVGSTTTTPMPAPELACGGGTCHVVWATDAGSGRSTVRYARADAPYTTWSSPVDVAGSAPSSESQFLPAVAAGPGGRGDVVYLDTRPTGIYYAAFQTSFSATGRGRDVQLTADISPPTSTFGDRIAAVGYVDAAFPVGGTAAAYVPSYAGDLWEAELWHGWTTPTLPPPAGTDQPVGKNDSLAIDGWLVADDLDGDPVTITTPDPAHGSVSGSTYSPDLSFAGHDDVVVQADDGWNPPTAATHGVDVQNAAPALDAPGPVIVSEGSSIDVPLTALDPDPADAIGFSIVNPGWPLNVAGRLQIVGTNLRITVPSGVRSLSPVNVTIRATDTTTPSSLALTADQGIAITLQPQLAVPEIGKLTLTGNDLTRAFFAPVTWPDAAASCLAAGTCHLRHEWTFDDGTTATVLDRASVTHAYARPGVYRPEVRVTVLYGAWAVSASRAFSGDVTVAADGRRILSVQPTVRVSRNRAVVRVRVRGRSSGSVLVRLRVGKTTISRRVQLSGGSVGDLGAARTVTFSVPRLSSLASRRARLDVRYEQMLATDEPAPSAVLRTLILR